MIKINLAKKKQATGMQSASNPTMRRASAGEGLQLLKDPKIRQILLLVVGLGGAYWTVEEYKNDELLKADAAIQAATQKSNQLKAEAAKSKGFEDLKKSLESDELAIRTKIETIQKLVAERQVLPKAMQSLATLIPQDVWLTDFKAVSEEFTFKGYSLGYNQVSDFMKSLGESAYFTDLRMASSQSARDETGSEVAQFELGAKRRQ